MSRTEEKGSSQKEESRSQPDKVGRRPRLWFLYSRIRMAVDHPCFRAVALAAAAVLVCLVSSPSRAAEAKARNVPTAISVAPGTLVRWSVPGTTRCRTSARSWAPPWRHVLFPDRRRAKPGVVTVGRKGQGHSETARITVEPRNYGTQEIELPDIPQANPSPADLKRNDRERVLLTKIFNRKEGSAEVHPASGKTRQPVAGRQVVRGRPCFQRQARRAQPHTGSDYPVPVSAPVLAVADGTVSIGTGPFYPGNAVFIDHGDGSSP